MPRSGEFVSVHPGRMLTHALRRDVIVGRRHCGATSLWGDVIVGRRHCGATSLWGDVIVGRRYCGATGFCHSLSGLRFLSEEIVRELVDYSSSPLWEPTFSLKSSRGGPCSGWGR